MLVRKNISQYDSNDKGTLSLLQSLKQNHITPTNEEFTTSIIMFIVASPRPHSKFFMFLRGLLLILLGQYRLDRFKFCIDELQRYHISFYTTAMKNK